MKTLVVIFINLILVLIACLTARYSNAHYTDGGCNGGFCGILTLIHSLPLLVCWLLEIAAFNLGLKGKPSALICLILSVVINTWVYNRNYGYDLRELYLEPEVLYCVAAIGLSVYVWADFSATAEKDDKLLNEKRHLEKIHPALYSAFAFWLMCYLVFKLLRPNPAVWLDLLFGIAIIALLILIYKQQKWAFYLLLIVLVYRICAILYFNTTHEVQFASLVLIAANVYLLSAVCLQHRLQQRQQQRSSEQPRT